jgi:wyosine [tRNA(Phe)-imidazoG37] synthetase (radical SAM superfamily)
MREVQDALMAADLVLPSLDAGDEQMFRYVNRPHEEISFARMIEGIAAFTKRFRGKVWLEVFLLAGVTGIPAEVERIISVIQRIQPTRVQLNTVSRPPAEKSALPLSPDQMLSLKRFFPGQVDIISEKGPNTENTSRLSSPRDFDILGLLTRRPCTAADVARGLGLHVTEALKRLEALLAAGEVKTVVVDSRTFYAVVGSIEAPSQC